MEFKINDQEFGQVRIYILPDDVGRSLVTRNKSTLRRSMQQLLAEIDSSKSTWNGEWTDESPIIHLNQEEQDDATLFHIFNTLPSPEPNPDTVMDEYARSSMHAILESNIEGLTTQLYQYQRRSAATMLQREIQPLRILDPRLRALSDQQGRMWYCDFNTATCLKEARTYESPRGGK